MSTDLNSYLASRYLVTDSKPTKKRKRKNANQEAGLLIAEDDSGWGIPSSRQDNDDDTGPTVVAGTSAEFRKTKSSNWKSLSADTDARRREGEANADDADAIIEAAAAEHEAALQDDNEGPTIAEDTRLTSSARGATASSKKGSSRSARRRDEDAEAETAYRDAAGNRIDISMRRAMARKAAAEQEEKGRLAREALMGDAQKEEALRRRERLEDAALMPLARKADDEVLNRELKEEQRWNDPMAQFLGAKPSSGDKRAGSKRKAPIYGGPAPPNRYGIRPGYRWDGVDRGNGFEAERFKAFNKRAMNKDLEYAWQMDV